MERELREVRVGEEREGTAGEGRGREGEQGGGRTEWVDRLRKLEKKYEWRERGERRRNLLVKGVTEGERVLKEEVEKVIRRLGAEVRIEDIRKIEAGKMDKGGLVVIKVGSEGERREVLRNKWKLRGENVWIEEDLTWEERKVRWKLRELVSEQRSEGKLARLGQGGVWMEEVWWKWDEDRGELRDGRGRKWEKGKKDREEKGKEEEGEEVPKKGGSSRGNRGEEGK